MTKMGDFHRKVTCFMNTIKPKTLEVLLKKVLSISMTSRDISSSSVWYLSISVKTDQQAISFLRCFQRYHDNKHPPLLKERKLLSDLLNEVPEEEPQMIQQPPKEQIDWEQISPGPSCFKMRRQRPNTSINSNMTSIQIENEILSLINRAIACADVNVSPESVGHSRWRQ